MRLYFRNCFKFPSFIVGLAGACHKFDEESCLCNRPDAEGGESDIVLNETTYRIKKRRSDVSMLVQNWRMEQKTPAISVAISVNGKMILNQGYGVQDIETGIAANADMVGNVASITKLFTAHCLLWHGYLQTNGHFDLYQTAFMPLHQSYIHRDWMNRPTTYTLRDLLTHQSGFRHYFWMEHHNPNHYARLDDAWERVRKTEELVALVDVGAKRYGSPAYDFLGLVASDIMFPYVDPYYDTTIDRYSAGLHSTLKGLNYRNTSLHRVNEIYYNQARGVGTDQECSNTVVTKEITNCPYVDHSYMAASEGLVSNVSDLVTFGNWYLILEQGLREMYGSIAQRMVREMWMNPVASGPDSRTFRHGYGLGWHMMSRLVINKPEARWQTTAYHNGGALGYSSTLFITTLKDQQYSLAEHHMYPYGRNQNHHSSINSQPPPPPNPRQVDPVGICVAIIDTQSFDRVEDLAEILTEFFYDDLLSK